MRAVGGDPRFVPDLRQDLRQEAKMRTGKALNAMCLTAAFLLVAAFALGAL